MKDLIKILAWIFLIVLAFILQANHFLSLKSINPNLILLIIFWGIFLEKKFSRFLVLIFIVILLAVVFLPYWIKEIFILSGLGLIIFLFKNFLTGNIFFDFLITILLGNLGFYLIINPRYFLTDPVAIIGELFYNMVLGFIIIFGAKSFSYEKETRIKS
jgi:hypothetical protein